VQGVEFADGSTKKELVFDGRIQWEGDLREVQIYLTASAQALVGAGLFLNRLVTLDYRSGALRIEK